MNIYSYSNKSVIRYDAPITKDARRRFELMKEDFIKLKFTTDEYIEIEIGDFVEDALFGRFELTEAYTPTPNAKQGGYDYDLVFEAQYRNLKNKIVKYSSNGSYAEVNWALTQYPSVFLEIFKQNTNFLASSETGSVRHFKYWNGSTYQSYNFAVQPKYNDREVTLSFSNMSLVDAFSSLAQAMNDGEGVDWWFEEGTFYFGNCEDWNPNTHSWSGRNTPFGLSMEDTFGQSINVESISVSEGKETLATRIIPFGSTRNITKRYRKKLEFTVGELVKFNRTTAQVYNGFFAQKIKNLPIRKGYFGTSKRHYVNTYSHSENTSSLTYTNMGGSTSDEPKMVGVEYIKVYYEPDLLNRDIVITYSGSSTFNVNTSTTGEVTSEPFIKFSLVRAKDADIPTPTQVLTGEKAGDVGEELASIQRTCDKTSDKHYQYSASGIELKWFGMPETQNGTSLYLRTSVYAQGSFLWTSNLYSNASNSKYNISVKSYDILTTVKFISGDLAGNEYDCMVSPLLYLGSPIGIDTEGVVSPVYSVNSETGLVESSFPMSDVSAGDKFELPEIIKGLVPFEYFKSAHDNEVEYGVVSNNLMLPNEPCYQDTNGKLWRDSELTSQQKAQMTLVYNGNGYIDVDSTPISQIKESVVVFESVYPAYNSYVESATFTSEDEIDDQGDLTGQKIYYWEITDSHIQFDNTYILQDTVNIAFGNTEVDGELHTGGLLNGMHFGIKNLGVKNNVSHFRIIPEEYTVSYPNDTLYPQSGDGFSLYGVDTSFFDATLEGKGEMELLRVVLEYIEDIKKDKKTYNLNMMSDWVYSQMNYSTTPTETFRLGTVVTLKGEQFGSGRVSRIIGIDYKLDYPFDTPTFIVGKTSSYSRLGAMESKIDNLNFSGVTYIGGSIVSSGGGTSVYLITSTDTTQASDSNTYSALRIIKEIESRISKLNLEGKFLSKVSDDTASGRITFRKGLKAVDTTTTVTPEPEETDGEEESEEPQSVVTVTPSADLESVKAKSIEFGSFQAGVSGSKIYNTGTEQAPQWTGEFDTVVVRNKLQATTIEIQHEKHIGGKLLNTAANMIVRRVTEVERPMQGVVAYRCYFDTKDKDGRTISNMWAQGDQAILKQFAVGHDEEGHPSTIASRYYWRLVTGVGTEVINGITYNYAQLSNTDGNYVGTDIPEVGDEVVQLGNQSDTNRQGAIILAAIGTEGESAPSFIGYNGINTFSLEDKEVWKLSPDDTKILADNIFIGDRTVTNAITNIDTEIAGITEGKFDVYQDELHNAPKNSSQAVLTYIAPTAYDYLPSHDWEAESYADHTNDILVFKDGITYKFDYVNNVYGWYIVTDSYLIAYVQELTEARQKIGDIVADDRITNDEKNEIQKIYDSIVKQHVEYLEIYNSLVGYQDKVEDWSAYQQAYNALCDNTNSTGYLKWIIDVVSATYTLVLGTGTFSRAQLNAAISTYYGYEAEIKSELESARLLPTGIDIQERRITVTSDTFKIQNNHGDRTLGVDENGDVTVVGALNRLVTTITSQNYSHYLIKGIHLNDVSTLDINYYSLDVLRCGDVIVIKSLPDNLGTVRIALPCAFYGKPSDQQEEQTYFIQTQTKFDQDIYNAAHGISAESHYLTKKELKQLIGKELIIFNDCVGSNQPILYWGIDVHPDESRYLKNGGNDVEPNFVYSIYNDDIVINPSSSVYPASTGGNTWTGSAMRLRFSKVQTVNADGNLSESYVWQRTGYVHGLDLDGWEEE